MMSAEIHLTEEQIKKITHFYDNNDQGRGHLELYLATNFPIAFDMAQISQFSGYIGGIAKEANNLIENESLTYHAGGVNKFSLDIGHSVSDYLKSKSGQGISELELINTAQGAWNKLGLKESFPGNPILGIEQIKEAISNFFSSGTYYTAQSTISGFTKGKKLEDFTLGNNVNNYKVQYSPDFSVRYVVDKDGAGKTVFAEKTGAVFNKESGEYTYDIYVPGVVISKDKLMAKLQITEDQIVFVSDSIEAKTGISHYKVVHKPSDNKINFDIKMDSKLFPEEISSSENQVSLVEEKIDLMEYDYLDFQDIDNSFSQNKEGSEDQYNKNIKNTEKTKEQQFKIIGASFMSIGSEFEKTGHITGNEGLQTAGMAIGSLGAAALGGATYIAESGLLAASGIGMVAAAGIALAGLIFSSKGDGDGLGESLVQIHKSLGVIRQEMHEEFHQVHKEIFELQKLVYQLHLYNYEKLERMMEFNNFGFYEVVGLVKTNIFSDAIKVDVNIETGVVPFDAKAFRDSLDVLKSIAIGVSKDTPFNGANLKPSLTSEVFIHDQLDFRSSPINNISFLIDYAKLKLHVKELPDGKNVVNFDLFYKGGQSFLKLVIQAIEHDHKVNNPAEKFINSNNIKYLETTLNNFLATNEAIVKIMVTIRKQVVSAAIQKYIEQLEEFSQFIQINAQEYSDKKGIEGLKGEYSLLSPDYEKLSEQDMHHRMNPTGGHNSWRCELVFNLKHVRKNDFYVSKEGAPVVGLETNLNALKRDCDNFIRQHYKDAYKNGEAAIKLKFIDYVKNDLKNERIDFFDSLIGSEQYKTTINNLINYKKLVKFYVNLLGEEFELDLNEVANNHIEILKNMPSNESILTNFNITTEMPNLVVLQNKIFEAQKNSSALISPREKNGELFKADIEMVRALLRILESNDKSKYSEKPKTEDMLKNKALKLQTEKIEKIYTELKYYFQKILDLSDDIRSALEINPIKFGKFNQLLDKVNIVNSVSEDLDLIKLKENYCEVFCVDQHSKAFVEFYRSMMKDDTHMSYISGELKALYEGEIQLCYC